MACLVQLQLAQKRFFKGSDEAAIFPYYYIDTRYTSDLIKKVTGVVFMILSVAPITKVPIFTIPMVDAIKEMYMQCVSTGGQTTDSFGWVFSFVLKLLIGGSQIVVALYCNDLARILTLVSAIVLTPLSFFFPVAIYVKLSIRNGKSSIWLTLFSFISVGVGILLWIYAVAELVYR